ncbi:MAG: UDP-glucose/GDP-mannose dehydrogenase family protein [Propionibacteriaceae bacterium]|jgi:UDPglucose 6-dehydrogenase|nr:UDP-glucose/GDP-mannose dehydrogenase family protein [Propionibacteriaceae bacterium]
MDQGNVVRASVIGCGYLGAVHAASLAALGHEVVGVDVDQDKIALLARGEAPFFEPGLADLLQAGMSAGKLRFSTDFAAAADCQLHFLAVGTPQMRGSQAADLTFIHAAVDALLPWLRPGAVVVGKSTVPVGTARELADKIAAAVPGALLAWNPEFLREGFAVEDTLRPDRIVYGLPADAAEAEAAKALLDQLYAKPLASGCPLISTDYQTAELVKVAANSFLATKISFINAMAEIAEVVGADVTKLADAIGFDQRIGRKFLNAGVGFGGGCLPKDIRAFQARADELGTGRSVSFLSEVDAINLRRRERVVELVLASLGDDYQQKRVAVLGLAFKPESDDVRDSPALDVAVRLHGLGVGVVATDPQAIGNARRLHPQLDFAATAEEAVDGAEVVVLVTEWRQYRDFDPKLAHALVARPVVIDGRNCLDADRWRDAGWTYLGMGR